MTDSTNDAQRESLADLAAGKPKLSAADRRFADRRHAARLAAAQALYQLEYGGRGVEAVITEFETHRFVPPPAEDAEAADDVPAPKAAQGVPQDTNGQDTLPLFDADAPFFAGLVRGVVAHQSQIDTALDNVLADGWSLRRIDATARAIMRVSAYELLHRPDTSTAVILDGALGVADAFFDDAEPKFINGALNALAASARSGAAADG